MRQTDASSQAKKLESQVDATRMNNDGVLYQTQSEERTFHQERKRLPWAIFFRADFPLVIADADKQVTHGTALRQSTTS